MPRKHELTEKQRLFVEHYIANGGDACKAYVSSRDSKMTGNALTVVASKYTRLPAVKAALDAIQAKAMATVVDRYAITKERVLDEMARIAFANITDIASFNPDGVSIKPSEDLTPEAISSISEVTEIKYKDAGSVVKVKQYDKQKALVDLGKHLGMFTEKHEHKHVAAAKFIIEK